jgi:flagellar hook-associated protein FlgK
MSDLLSISTTAVMAYQRALGTVSNNIANVGTEGYSRQEVSLTANTPSKQGNVYIGNGVRFVGIQRQVDDFIQSNLRNSQSELATQEPMVSYANRVVDIMGGEQTGLTTALNRFFDASRDLSGDPSSSVYRAAFLRESDSLTSSFRALSGQMQLIDDETREATESRLGELNTLVSQLALVNKQLAKNATQAKQPPELLDQRDRLLTQISQLSRITTKFEPSGAVALSLGTSMQQGLVLEGQDARPVTAVFDPDAPEKVDLYIGQFSSDPRALSSLAGGELGGLLAFREQVLNPARNALDDLARTLVAEVNHVHNDSMDAYGNAGEDLFGFDATGPFASAGMRLLINDTLKVAAAAQFRVAEDSNNPTNALATLSYSPVTQQNPADISAVLEPNGTLESGTAFSASASQPFKVLTAVSQGTQDAVVYLDQLNANQEIQVLTREGVHIAGKALSDDQESMILRSQYGFQVGSNYDVQYLNQLGDQAYKQADVFIGVKAAPTLSQVFDDAGGAMAGTPVAAKLTSATIGGNLTGAVIPAGALELNGVALGELRGKTGVLQANEIATWINTAMPNEVTPISGDRAIVSQAKLQLDTAFRFEGLQGDVVTIAPPVDSQTGVVGFANAQALADAINERTAVHLVTAEVNSDGALVLNQVAGAAWMSAMPGMVARAFNEIVTAAEKIDLTAGLTLKGHSGTEVGFAGPFESLTELVNTINAQRLTTRVHASVSAEGNFVLANLSGYEGEGIAIGNLPSQSRNTLGIPGADSPLVFGGQYEITRTLADPDADEIRIGFGPNGNAADLQRIGLRAGVYFAEEANDDYLVMVTGEGTFSASATYKANTTDPTARLRETPFQVVFTDDTHYTITDQLTGSVVASRDFDPTISPAEITYRGVTLTFSGPPSTGDKFTVDGNQDGVGDNKGILRMVALEGAKIMSGGRTLTESYIDEVSAVGNMAQRARVAKDALTVVFEQAKEARDTVSGVSLDEEAASLIRFQQAYQASAKVMQTASTLFDAILRVN